METNLGVNDGCAPWLKIPGETKSVHEDFIKLSYAIGKEQLKTHFRYIFKRATAGAVRKHNTKKDKERSQPPSNYNIKCKSKHRVTPGKCQAVRKGARLEVGIILR